MGSPKKSTSFSIKNLKPTPGFLIVEPAEVQTKTASGIYLPDSHEEKPQYGTVLAVGKDIFIDGKKVSSPAKKGDRVVYKKWGGNEVKLDNKEYQFLKFDDLLAVVK